jgi:hypothetical protein
MSAVKFIMWQEVTQKVSCEIEIPDEVVRQGEQAMKEWIFENNEANSSDVVLETNLERVFLDDIIEFC